MTAKIKLNSASGGGSVSIQAPSSMSNNRVITLPDLADGDIVTSQSTLDATKLSGALPAISGANLTGIASGNVRNLIINGQFQVAQRGSSSTTSGYGDLDRWMHEYAGHDEAPTFARTDVVSSDSGDNPFAKGLTKCMKITNGNQTGGFQNNRILNLNQNIEALNVRNSGWNYNSASSKITLSYYIKASVSQNYHGFVKTADGTNYVFQFETGVLTANTWTRITKTIPGHPSLQIDDSTGSGFQVFPIFFAGTDYTDDAINHTDWQAWASGIRSKDQASTWWTTDNATIEITGVLLEVGDSASDFPIETYAETLAKCQRYYYRLQHTFYGGTWNDGNFGMISIDLKQTMRASPTVTYGSMRTSSGLNVYSNEQRCGFYMNHDSPYGNDFKADAEI